MSSPNKYDQFGYVSAPFDYSHCRRLETAATLFGMQPAPISSARVLELGCGDGSNLIPQAENLPDASFLGIDYAQVPIAQGNELIKAVGLKNIELQALNVMDLDSRCGEFDYIIAHGLYSWVPAEVQSKLMELLPQLLAPQGVVFISYNILPGWNLKRTVRELMLVHTQTIDDPQEKVNQARAILQWVTAGARPGSWYREFLTDELKLLSRKPDGYIYHEHLEDQNEAIYFREFLERARSVDLQYLGEAELAFMFSHDIPPQQKNDLANVPIEVAEQLMDFMRNRAFRKTLLCHAKVDLQREPSQETLLSLYYGMESMARLEGIDLTASEPLQLQLGENNLTIPEPLLQAAMVEICHSFPASLSGERIAQLAIEQLRAAGVEAVPTQEQANEMVSDFVWRLGSMGVLQMFVHPPEMEVEVTDRPRASALVRHHATHSELATNRRHAWVKLDNVSRRMLCLLNGNRTRQELVEQVAGEIASGEVEPTESEKSSKPEELAREALERLASCSLLIG